MFRILSDKTPEGLSAKLETYEIMQYLTTWNSQGYYFQSFLGNPKVEPKVTKEPKATKEPKVEPKVTKEPKKPKTPRKPSKKT